MGAEVELVVSDNCSSDDTQEAVEWARQFCPIRSHRNPENIGGHSNFLLLGHSLARGRFFWLIGDDDLLRDSAVETVLRAIKENPDVDCIFVNSSADFRPRTDRLIGAAEHVELRNLFCHEVGTHRVSRWEDVAEFSSNLGLFTYIGSHVFRTERWREATEGRIERHRHDRYQSLDATYPHSVVIAKAMVGRPAVYIGFPYVVVYVGAHGGWLDWRPFLDLVRSLDFSDLLESLGARSSTVQHYRNCVFKGCGRSFWVLATNRRSSGRRWFSVSALIRRYWRYPAFWGMLVEQPYHELRSTLSGYMRRALSMAAVGNSLARVTRTRVK